MLELQIAKARSQGYPELAAELTIEPRAVSPTRTLNVVGIYRTYRVWWSTTHSYWVQEGEQNQRWRV